MEEGRGWAGGRVGCRARSKVGSRAMTRWGGGGGKGAIGGRGKLIVIYSRWVNDGIADESGFGRRLDKKSTTRELASPFFFFKLYIL